MKKPIRSFFLSVSFLALAGLAFNPHVVVELQDKLGFGQDDPRSNDTSPDIPLLAEEKIPNESSSIPKLKDSPPVPNTTPALKTQPLPPLENPVPQGDKDRDTDVAEIAEVISEPPVTPTSVTQPDQQSSVSEPVILIPNEPVLKLPLTAKPDLDNLPRLSGHEKIAKDDDWIGALNCGTDIFDLPLSLPRLTARDSGILTNPITTANNETIVDQPYSIFKSQNGITLRVVQPVFKYYATSGRTYLEAHNYITDRKPLDDVAYRKPRDGSPDPIAETGGTTLANILSPVSLSYQLYGYGLQYSLVNDKTVITAAYIVTLPIWENYHTASSEDKAKWDDLICNASHHELGHLRIGLDIIAETLDGYSTLPSGVPKDELERLTNEYHREVTELIDDRQDAYHIYNGGGLRRGMTELPYAELPFPWLTEAQGPN